MLVGKGFFSVMTFGDRIRLVCVRRSLTRSFAISVTLAATAETDGRLKRFHKYCDLVRAGMCVKCLFFRDTICENALGKASVGVRAIRRAGGQSIFYYCDPRG